MIVWWTLCFILNVLEVSACVDSEKYVWAVIHVLCAAASAALAWGVL